MEQLNSFKAIGFFFISYIVYDYVRAEDIPFMKLKKIRKSGGEIVWKREIRPPLTSEEEENIESLTASKAKLLPTEEKRVWFYNEIQKIRQSCEDAKTMIVIDREHFFRDSFEQFKTTLELDLRGELSIHFLDELAEDVGGLEREWFCMITKELFKPELGLFKKANTKELSYVINENVKNNPMLIEYFEFAGKVLAKALYDRIPIKCYLNTTILSQLLGNPLPVEKLKEFDEELWNSIDFIRNNKIKDGKGLGMTFTVANGSVELVTKGKEILVNDKNKEEFCTMFADYFMTKSINAPLIALLKGFYYLIPKETISIFDEDELLFFICGDPNIDMNDWKNNTTYKQSYDNKHQVIIWFWEAISSLTEEEKRTFLQFCTGSSRVPVEGFKGLLSNNGKVCTFCIEPKDYSGPETSFIVAHTCFNRIELPLYPGAGSHRAHLLCEGLVLGRT